VRKQVGQPQRT